MSLKKPQELESGMVLAADVLNLDGQTLFKAGLELEDRQIEILQMWGIPNVEIAGEQTEEELVNLDQFPPHILKKAERLVDIRFKLVKSPHPVVNTLRKFCVSQEAKALLTQDKAK